MVASRSIFRAMLALPLGILLGLSACGAFAQSTKDAYLQDARGTVIRNTPVGDARIGNLCWRTGYWTPALSIAECDPDIAPRPAPPAPNPSVPPAPKPAASATAPVVQGKCDFAETLGADETFEFNQSTLRDSAKARLDAVVARAKACAQVNTLRVTGHTDRIGSASYNLKLSELRAAVVAAYLGSRGLGGATIAGAGKTLPVKACDGRQPRKVLVACLAPNRRVEIEIQGPAR